MVRSRLEVSLAAPAYNEGEGIEEVVLSWVTYLRARLPPGAFEIVVCNDGSKDDTGVVLNRLAATVAELKPLHHAKNQGASAALITAIGGTTKPWVLLIDSDGQFPVENLDRFLDAWEDGVDAYLGVRPDKKDTLFTRAGSWASGQTCNVIHGSHLRDFNSAFKLVRGPLLRAMRLEAKGLNYSTEATSKLIEVGARLLEVEVSHRPRVSGQSSMRLLRGGLHRGLFVSYLGLRQLLLKMEVISPGSDRTSAASPQRGQDQKAEDAGRS